MSDVVVVTPTVEARQHVREATLDQWRTLGFEPLIIEQGPPYGHRRQRENSRAAIRAGLDTGAAVIIHAEDDIDLDPRIPRVLPACLGPAPCSLWHRPRFEPPGVARPGQVVVTPARAPVRWYSALCVVMTRAQAEHALTLDYGRGGWDLDLRLTGVRITVPSLVQHRHLPRVASRGGWIGAVDWEGK